MLAAMGAIEVRVRVLLLVAGEGFVGKRNHSFPRRLWVPGFHIRCSYHWFRLCPKWSSHRRCLRPLGLEVAAMAGLDHRGARWPNGMPDSRLGFL